MKSHGTGRVGSGQKAFEAHGLRRDGLPWLDLTREKPHKKHGCPSTVPCFLQECTPYRSPARIHSGELRHNSLVGALEERGVDSIETYSGWQKTEVRFRETIAHQKPTF